MRGKMQSRAVEYRNHLIAVHDRGCSYYEAAESPEWLARFWAPDCRFRLLFETLDLANVIDFACGHGRHTAQFLARADHVTLVDANASNIQVCRKRFAGSPKIRCLVNEATSVPCPSSMYSAVFS